MILDPFSVVMGGIVGVLCMSLGIEFGIRWRARHDAADPFAPLDESAPLLFRPLGWTTADEARSVRAALEGVEMPRDHRKDPEC